MPKPQITDLCYLHACVVMRTRIADICIDEILPYSVLSTPLVWVKPTDKAWVVSSMLYRYLVSFTDCLAVIDNGQFVGTIDGRDMLGAVFRNPTYDFFQHSVVTDFMVKGELAITLKTKLSELIKKWSETKRAYAILKNNNDNFFTISVRTLAEASIFVFNELKDSDIQKNKIVTCYRDNTIKEVLELMFKRKVRRVFYDDYQSFISDRSIIKKIIDLRFLVETDKFLDMQMSQFESSSPVVVKNGLSYSELIKNMINKEHPCLLFPDNTIMTFYDIVISFGKFLK